ncbi:MAG: hypothetical protein WA851_20870 [Xanthobacteraceae bacterium]
MLAQKVGERRRAPASGETARLFVALDASVRKNLRRAFALVEIGLRLGHDGTKQRNQADNGGETPNHPKFLNSQQKAASLLPQNPAKSEGGQVGTKHLRLHCWSTMILF